MYSNVLDAGIERSPHVPDISIPQCLLDVIVVGNVIELTVALDHQSYSGMMGAGTIEEEQEAANTWYRFFIRWFCKKNCVLIGNHWLNPAYIFKKSLVDFAATILFYKMTEH